MKTLNHIKDHYSPIQPTVKLEHTDITYQEIAPKPAIEHVVYCFWQLKTNTILKEPFVYQVVSDGCIDIFFNHKAPSESFIMGFCRKYTEFPLEREFDYIGIRFLPAAFPLLFGINAKALSNQSQDLRSLLPDVSIWIEHHLRANTSFPMIVELLNAKLKEIVEKGIPNLDLRFFNALSIIFQKRGVLDTEKDLDIGISSRQLRRVFNYYIGTTPKAFSNVVRFQYILSAKPSVQSLKENKLYFDVGFFDQAHFIKSFKTFYGVTPSEAFR